MSVTAGWLLLNSAYFIYTVSGLFKDMLRLRIVWMISTLLFMTHGVVDELWPAVWWNVPVLVVHAWMISRLVTDRRRIDLDEEAEAIHQLMFSDLDRVQFNTLWHHGYERTLEDDDVLLTKGQDVNELTLLLEGECDVRVNESLRVRLNPYRLIGEISSFTGEPATATVRANGVVRCRSWNKLELDACGVKNPRIHISVLRAMGHEAARKVV